MSCSRARPSRRQLLSLSLVAGIAVTAPGIASAVLTATRSPTGPAEMPSLKAWSYATSQNGWPVAGSGAMERIKVEGSNARVLLHPGAPALVLLHVARRFHYEVETLGTNDVVGHRDDRGVQAVYESNQLSGTALHLHPSRHPIGATGTLFPLQVAVLRDILAECDGVVRWGGDYCTQPAEGYFHLDAQPDDPTLKRVVARLNDWQTRPGLGAGGPVDVAEPARRSKASRLQKIQQTT